MTTAAVQNGPSRFAYLARMAIAIVRRPKIDRSTANVLREYSDGWSAMKERMLRARDLEEWLNIPGMDGAAGFYNVDGQLEYQNFNSADFYRRRLLDALGTYFPEAASITEFGAGVGRNLLFLKRERPDLTCQGYELCPPGVEIGQTAAERFGLAVRYAPLDFVNDPPAQYVLPVTDVGFTMFALEQIPREAGRAVRNILDHVRLGTIHMEPVPENYPFTPRGILGRIDHWKVDYLSGFDRAVRELRDIDVIVEPLSSAHNPFMFPSLYVLRRR